MHIRFEILYNAMYKHVVEQVDILISENQAT